MPSEASPSSMAVGGARPGRTLQEDILQVARDITTPLRLRGTALACAALLGAAASTPAVPAAPPAPATAAAGTTASSKVRPAGAIDKQLKAALAANGFTGTIQRDLETLM